MADYRELIRRMTHAINVMDGIYYEWARKQGIKENIVTLMYALDDGEPHSQKQLCDEWLIAKTTLNTIVKECEAKELLVLKSDGGHGREKQICLTEAGREYAAKILEPLYAMENEAMRRTLSLYSDDFVEAMECLCDNMKGAMLNLQGGQIAGQAHCYKDDFCDER